MWVAALAMDRAARGGLLDQPTLLSNPTSTTLGTAAAWLTFRRIDHRSLRVKQRPRAARRSRIAFSVRLKQRHP